MQTVNLLDWNQTMRQELLPDPLILKTGNK